MVTGSSPFSNVYIVVRQSVLALIFCLYLVTDASASSWMVYPWKLKNNNIRVESIPYKIYQGYDLGVTRVYFKRKMLYKIDRYFSNYCVTNQTGEFFISMNFEIRRSEDRVVEVDSLGNRTRLPLTKFKGEAFRIYQNGILIRQVEFDQLSIDTSNVKIHSDRLRWVTNDSLMSNSPIIVDHDTAFIICCDNQILRLNLRTNSFNTPIHLTEENRSYYSDQIPKRKMKVRTKNFPEQFIEPELDDGKTIEKGLAEYLEKHVSNRDSGILQLYIHTLLISSKGECSRCHISASMRENVNERFPYPYNEELGKKIELWFERQRYKTNLIPKYTDKYAFSFFIYLN